MTLTTFKSPPKNCTIVQQNKNTWIIKVHGEKAFIAVDGGVIILPRDGSYKRFISNTWYNDINTDNL